MCLSRYLDEMNYQLSSFLGYDDPNRLALETIDGMERRIRRCKLRVRQLRTSLESLEQRIREKRNRIERLTSRVEVYLHLQDHANAWQYAMTLDRLYQLVEEETGHYCQIKRSLSYLTSRKKDYQKKLANFLATFYPNR